MYYYYSYTFEKETILMSIENDDYYYETFVDGLPYSEMVEDGEEPVFLKSYNDVILMYKDGERKSKITYKPTKYK
jgi:hypothetical protein